MSTPNRDNPYSFDDYLAWRNQFDFYADDPLAQKIVRQLAGNQWETIDAQAREFSQKVSFRYRDIADTIARPELRPTLQNYDAHHRRIDRIVRPAQIESMETEIFSEGLFSQKTHPVARLIKTYLLYQLGEACTSCPLVCTEGLVALLARFADDPVTLAIREHCQEGRAGEFAIGAQYLSEIQGGSDVPANLLEAVEEDGSWKLYGTKFFCSATHADYAVVTAKPRGSEDIAIFVLPSWLPGDKAREKRNGFTIDRLKWKMGTSELPTCELGFDGAVAYPLGPLNRGLANVVGIVLTASRLTVGLSSAALMTRAAREAAGYCQFREAFGTKLSQFPMVKNQLADINHAAGRTTAAAFKIYDLFSTPAGDSDKPEAKMRAFELRELIMLQKMGAAFDCTDVIRSALSLLGGHGVIEDFSCLPRLYRDAAVNELWEGPRNVLLAQIHRDMQRAAKWYPAADFVHKLIGDSNTAEAKELAQEFAALVAHPDLLSQDQETESVCRRWDQVCQQLLHAYQDLALQNIEQT